MLRRTIAAKPDTDRTSMQPPKAIEQRVEPKIGACALVTRCTSRTGGVPWSTFHKFQRCANAGCYNQYAKFSQ